MSRRKRKRMHNVKRSSIKRRSRNPVEMRTKAERLAAGDHAVIGWKDAKRARWARRTLMQKQRGCCALCDEQMNLAAGDDREATLDHIIPVSHGGTDEITNLQLACRACNEARGNDPLP